MFCREEGLDLLIRVAVDFAAGAAVGATVPIASGRRVALANAIQGDVPVDEDDLELNDLVVREI